MGLEWTLTAIVTSYLGFHPALAFTTYQVADAFIHPLRRQLEGTSVKSELLIN